MTSPPLSDDLSPDTADVATGPGEVPTPDENGGTPRSRWAGYGRWSLGRHSAALAVILLALVPVAGTGAVWSADEGALLYQATAVAEGRWEFEHPLPAVDPSGTAFPIHLSSWAIDGSPGPDSTCGDAGSSEQVGGCRYVVLAKHSTYLRLVAWLHTLGGYGLVILASTLGTLAAALAAARLARLLDQKADRAALWLAGLGSPLLINGYVAWAHTLAAAAVGWALVLLLSGAGLDRRPGRSSVSSASSVSSWATAADLVAGGGLLALACLLRTEASIAGTAVALGLLAVSRSRLSESTGDDDGRLALGRAGMVAGVATVAGTVVDRLTSHPTAGPVEPLGFEQAFGLVTGRMEAFAITWLRPGYGAEPVDLLIMAASAAVVGGAVLGRRGHPTSGPVLGALALACGLLIARLVMAPTALIPGLMMAFPVLLAGLVLGGRSLVDRDVAAAITAPFVLFCIGVLATQYRGGGGGEWGGRYFAIGLPLGVAMAAVGLRRGLARFQLRERRAMIALGCVSMAVLSTLGILGLREVRLRTAELAHLIDQSVTAAVAIDGSTPVVVTTVHGTGRWMWDDIDRVPWLRVPSDDLAEIGARLAEVGADPVILVTPTARLDGDSRSMGRYIQAPLDQRPGSIGETWAVVTLIDQTRIDQGVRPSREAPVEDP